MRQTDYRQDAEKRRRRMDEALKRTFVRYEGERRFTFSFSSPLELERLLLEHEVIKKLTRANRRPSAGGARGETRITPPGGEVMR